MTESASAKTLRSARRDAWFVFLCWLAALGWTLTYCAVYGYPPEDRLEHPVPTVLGFPQWVFIGILLPWIVCSLLTIAYGLFGMQDNDLGQENEEASPHGY